MNSSLLETYDVYSQGEQISEKGSLCTTLHVRPELFQGFSAVNTISAHHIQDSSSCEECLAVSLAVRSPLEQNHVTALGHSVRRRN